MFFPFLSRTTPHRFVKNPPHHNQTTRLLARNERAWCQQKLQNNKNNSKEILTILASHMKNTMQTYEMARVVVVYVRCVVFSGINSL